MARFLHRLSLSVSSGGSMFFLASAWILGLLTSGMLFRDTGSGFSSLITEAAGVRASFGVLMVHMLLPLLLSAAVVAFLDCRLLYPLGFCHAWGYGYISCGILSSFSGSGWLLRWLLLFSATLCNFVIWFFWIGCFCRQRGFLSRLVFSAAAIGFIVSADCYFIAPLLRLSLV